MVAFKVIKYSDITRCPIMSLLPSHYRPDGSCLCKLYDYRVVYQTTTPGHFETQIVKAVDAAHAREIARAGDPAFFTTIKSPRRIRRLTA